VPRGMYLLVFLCSSALEKFKNSICLLNHVP